MRPFYPGRPEIAESGKIAARKKASRTIDAVLQAMRDIEEDVERNAGIYPYSEGEISTAEVLRRAGLSTAVLQKPIHRVLRSQVNSWVTETRTKILRGAKVVRKAVTERADSAESKVRQIRQAWVEAELNYIAVASQIAELTVSTADLKQKIAALETENEQLRARLSGLNVPPLKNRRPR